MAMETAGGGLSTWGRMLLAAFFTCLYGVETVCVCVPEGETFCALVDRGFGKRD